MPKDINLILPSDRELGAVYISDIKTAQSQPALKEYRIGAIVSVFRGGRLSHSSKDVPRYLYLPAQDKQTFNISQYFQTSANFIDQARRHTNVLVHCVAGISRSATIVAAYIITKYGYSAESALSLLQKRRKKVSPNKGFRLQLQKICMSSSGKKRLEDEQTVSSPNKIEMTKSMSLHRQNINETTQRPHAQRHIDHMLMTFNHSSVIKSTRKGSEASLNKQKIVSKIEKVKATLINKLANSSHFQHHVTMTQPVTLTTLLQSKIYQNKLKTKI